MTCKKLYKNSKKFINGDAPKKFTALRDERSFLRELGSNRFESLTDIILPCRGGSSKKSD